MTGPTTVGSIDAKLTVDDSDFKRGMAEAKAEAKEVGALHPEVKVDADVGPALAKLEAVAAAERDVTHARGVSIVNTKAESEAMQAAGRAAQVEAQQKALVTAVMQAEQREQSKLNNARIDAAIAAKQLAREEKARADGLAWETSALKEKLEASRNGAAGTEQESIATDKLSSAKRSLQIAEANLDKVRKDSKATVQQRLQAENSIASATRAVAAATDDDTAATDRNTSANRRRVSGLQVLIGLAPAILAAAAPIAAGAVGLGVAFGVMGVSGLLAIKGIKDAMEVGDGVGNQYAAGIGVLKRNLDTLSAVSANAMLDSFNRSVGDINNKMPFLNQLVSQGSSLLGQMGGTALSGVLNGLEKMNPLIQTGGVELGKFVTWLFSFTGTNGFTEFINYAVTNLPGVMTLIESLVTTAGHILAAFAPLGPVVIGLITALSDGLASLPTPVLAGLVTTATLLGPALRIAGTAMAIFGIESQLAVPVVGVLLAAISGLGIMAATAALGTDTGADSVARYRAELERTNGVIGEGIRNQAAKAVADSEGAGAAKGLGIATSDLTGYILGNKDAQDRVNASLSAAAGATSDATKGITAYGSGARVTTQESADLQSKVRLVEDVLMSQTGALGEAKTKWQEYQDALNGAKGATDTNTAAVQLQAGVYGTTVQMYQNAATAQQTAATQYAQTTVNMQQQNDAAGILKQSLDTLNGKAISAAQAQNSFDSSLVNMGDHVSATGKKITFTTTSIGDMSSASVALRGQLNGQVVNLQNVVAANGGLSESTGKAKAQMEEMRTQIIDNAVAHGVDKDAVTAYVDNLLKIPATVPPTTLDINATDAELKIAGFQRAINSLTGKTVTIYAQANIDAAMASLDTLHANSMVTANQYATGAAYRSEGGPVYKAGGGIVDYLASGGHPGVPRGTDTVPAWLTPREFVMRRASAESIGVPALNYMNATGQLPPQQQAQQGGGGGPLVETINIYDQHDPVATSMDVQRRLAMIAT